MLLTDGRYDTKIPANLVRQLEKDVVSRVIVVGIGAPDPIQLWQISSDPNNVQNMMLPEMIEPVARTLKNSLVLTLTLRLTTSKVKNHLT